jgi:hypothetical protein
VSKNLPDRFGTSGLRSFSAGNLPTERRRADRAVLQHAIKAWVADQKLTIDLRSASAAIEFATEEELNFLSYGLSRAGGDQTKLAIVVRKLELLAQLNDRRIRGEFG